jgi:hypothetical protein
LFIRQEHWTQADPRAGSEKEEMRIKDTKIKFNRSQIIAMVIASLMFLGLFVVQAVFWVKTGYSPMVIIIVALIVSLYLARDKNPN